MRRKGSGSASTWRRGRSHIMSSAPRSPARQQRLTSTSARAARASATKRLYNRSLMSSLRVLISAEQIQARIPEPGPEIDRDYPQGPVYLIAILKGACFFLADLARAMKTPARIEFIGISSFGKGKTSSGQVQLTKDLDAPIEGHHVIVVEDILDTGITLNYLTTLIAQRKPKSLRIVTLLDKPERRQSPVQANYVGFTIPDEFVVGYGLDYAE